MSHAASRIEPEEEILLFYFRLVAIGMYDRTLTEACLLYKRLSVMIELQKAFAKVVEEGNLWLVFDLQRCDLWAESQKQGP